MDCNSCKEKKKAAEPVPYIAHEGAMARQERANKRLWIVVIILIAALILSNAAWIYYESRFVDESWTYEATTDDGGNAIANGDGEVNYYGESKSDPQETNP